MTDSLATRLRRQAQELLDLAEVLEPIGAVAAPRLVSGTRPLGASALLVRKAAALVGGQSNLANTLGIHLSNVNKMCTGRADVSADKAEAIHDATDGQVARWQLRPDLFDAPQPEPVELSV